MKDSVIRGMIGERACANYLVEHGYSIEGANYKTRFGEIDIVAADGKYLAFVEVKTRGEEAWESPCTWVTAAKQRKVALAAGGFLLQYGEKYADFQPRFDVMEVIMDSDKNILKIRHIENAFDAPYGID